MGKYCYNCGAELKDGARFCHICGREQVVTGAISPDGSMATSQGGAAGAHQTSFPDVVAQTSEPSNVTQGTVGTNIAGTARQMDQTSSTMPLAVLDVALFAAVTFFPWVSSTYAGSGSGLSLPKLAMEGMNLMSEARQYQDYAYSFGAHDLYQNAQGVIVLVAVVAGLGWLSAVASLLFDLKEDMAGRRASGGGCVTVAVVAAVVQVLVWIGVAYIKKSLENDYFDISYALNDVIMTTAWVWVCFVAAIAGNFFRHSVYQSLGWESAPTVKPSQSGQAG